MSRRPAVPRTRPEVGLTPEERERLARDHRPLVAKWCQKLAPYAPDGMDPEEIQALALAGLAHALDKYDPTRRVTFGAYAGPWVRGAILRGFERSRDTLWWRGQVVDNKVVAGQRSRWETLAEPVQPRGPTVIVAAILVDGMNARQMEATVTAIERANPSRLAVVTGEEAEELLALPDTRRLVAVRGDEGQEK